jgi:alkylation response protein AidB-like acyl-CoA dehydrogenase
MGGLNSVDFALTEEQKQIKALIKDYYRRERLNFPQLRGNEGRAAYFKTIEEYRVAAAAGKEGINKLFDAGLAQLAVPTKYGGGGMQSDLVTLMVAAEEAGYQAEGIGAGMGASWLGTSAIALGGTEEQQDWFFPQFMEKHILTGAASSEPTGTTDSNFPYDEGGGSVMKTFAYKDGHEWVINGQKMWGGGLAIADYIQLTARTDKNAPVSKALTTFWVPRDAPGLTLTPNHMSGFFSSCQSFYDNVRIPENYILGKVNEGFYCGQLFFSQIPILWAGGMGWTQRIYEQIREFAKERVQGGKPIIQHSVVRAMLGEFAAIMETTRCLLYRNAWETTMARTAGLPVNAYWADLTAYQVKKMWLRCSEIGSEIWGGLAAPIDMPLQDYWQAALHHAHGGGTINVMAMKAAVDYEERYMGHIRETAK